MGNARINTLEKYVTIIIIRSMYFWNCDCIYFQFICAFRFIVKRGKFVKYESKCTYERKEKKNDLWRFFLPTRRFIWKYKAFKSNRTRMIFLFFFFFCFKDNISSKANISVEEKGRRLYDNIKYFTFLKVVLTSKEEEEEEKRLLIRTREARF